MNLLKPFLRPADLKTVAAAVSAAEARSGGEIRVEVRQRRARSERSLSIEQIARQEFVSLGMTATRDRTGVLLFLLLEDRELCILADDGIHGKVADDTWTRIAANMTDRFGRGQFTEGLVEAVEAVGSVLEQHVPRRPDDRNELPNTVIQR